ncbi:MAG: ribosome silencing factor [Pseudomonadota bacterium]
MPLDFILTILDKAKSENLVTLPLEGKSNFVDYMVIVNGTSDRHIASIAQTLSEELRQNGYGSFHPEGGENGNWMLMDLGNVIVHIFKPEVRELYALEKMWSVRCDVADKPVLIS